MALEAASGARPAVTTQKHSRGLGKARLRFGSWGFASRRQLAPPRRSPALGGPGRRGEHGPGAVRSFQRARPGRGGGSTIRNPRSASSPRRSSLASRPGDPPSTRSGDPRHRSPGRAPAGTPTTSQGHTRSSPRRFRARHHSAALSRPRGSAPSAASLGSYWSLDLLNHRRRCRLAGPRGASGPPARERPESPPGLSWAPRLRVALWPAPSRGLSRAAVCGEDGAHPTAEQKRPGLSSRTRSVCNPGSEGKALSARPVPSGNRARGRRSRPESQTFPLSPCCCYFWLSVPFLSS